MNSEKYTQLENRAAETSALDEIERLQARVRVNDVIQQMKAEGSAHELSAEEEAMLLSFRRFKLRMRKDGEVFTWQTRRPSDIEIVEETGLVLHPSEA